MFDILKSIIMFELSNVIKRIYDDDDDDDDGISLICLSASVCVCLSVCLSVSVCVSVCLSL